MFCLTKCADVIFFRTVRTGISASRIRKKIDPCCIRTFVSSSVCGASADEGKFDTVVGPDETKLIKVAVIGCPNAGKSSLINRLTARRVCPVSSKVHTTRSSARAISVEDNTQIIFLDTPGVVTASDVKRFHLEDSFLQDSEAALMEADLIGVIHDVGNHWTSKRLDSKILRLLQLYSEKPSFLILNKIDLVKSKRKLLDLICVLTNNSLAQKTGQYLKGDKQHTLSEMAVNDILKGESGWSNFEEVFLISALSGDGVEKIMEYLISSAKPGSWLHPRSCYSDVSPEKIVSQTVKAKLLEHLPQEIPYSLKTTVEYFENSNSDLTTVIVGVICPSSRIEKLVVGIKGERIKTIARESETDLRNAFYKSVHLKIAVSSEKK